MSLTCSCRSTWMQVVRTSSDLHLSQPARQPASTPASQPATQPASQPASQPTGQRNALSYPEPASQPAIKTYFLLKEVQELCRYRQYFLKVIGSFSVPFGRHGGVRAGSGATSAPDAFLNNCCFKKRSQNIPKRQSQKCRFSLCF